MARGRKPVAGSKRQGESDAIRITELRFWLNATVDVQAGHPEPIALTSGDEERRFTSPALLHPFSLKLRAVAVRRALETDLSGVLSTLRAEAHARLSAVLHGTPFTVPPVRSVPRFTHPRLDTVIDEVVTFSKPVIETASRDGAVADADGLAHATLDSLVWQLTIESGRWFRLGNADRPADLGEAVMTLLSELLFIIRNSNNPELLFIEGMRQALPQVIRDAAVRGRQALRAVEGFRRQSP